MLAVLLAEYVNEDTILYSIDSSCTANRITAQIAKHLHLWKYFVVLSWTAN